MSAEGEIDPRPDAVGPREEPSGGPGEEHSIGPSEEHLLRVRVGHGANCSSVGSVIDTLFTTAVVGAAVFAAVVAALGSEEARVVGGRGGRGGPDEGGPGPSEPTSDDLTAVSGDSL